MKRMVSVVALACLLSGCGAVGRLQGVGKAPKMTAMDDPVAPEIEPSLGLQGAAHRNGATAAPAPSASLFRTGAGGFLRDQRASKVGDILTIRINIADKASVDNTTSRTRAGGETGGIAGLLGLETQLPKILPGKPDPSKLVDFNSNSTATGAGNTTRSEQINLTMAAIVTGVLPNGNLVIRGRQEVRVNFELRELIVTGIVRPEDIARDNTIAHSQIAEARISYGGRGQLTDAQQARWGQQIYDALFPF
ncbi:flagellar basal body L-ring protein FlgH [Sphingomonas quercus]|uniref:Flagellar L-ring protein n=1 Tax=Sphingomonas quercus TaxID=2842451 RepID=A0ABS6BK30_9SPHN|nr:flagellar basal body L-ring protein FlgH [Sphingomonas quercus]MBU3078663.1 flagellar basal body L-ring protein FlgH [Sphingomonas quercus]